MLPLLVLRDRGGWGCARRSCIAGSYDLPGEEDVIG